MSLLIGVLSLCVYYIIQLLLIGLDLLIINCLNVKVSYHHKPYQTGFAFQNTLVVSTRGTIWRIKPAYISQLKRLHVIVYTAA